MAGLAEARGSDNHVTFEAACFKPPARLPESLRKPFVAPIAVYPPSPPLGRRESVGGQEAAWMCQLGPGLPPTSPSKVGVVPFISQIEACPLVFCHKMSDLPSPL